MLVKKVRNYELWLLIMKVVYVIQRDVNITSNKVFVPLKFQFRAAAVAQKEDTPRKRPDVILGDITAQRRDR